VGIIARDTVTKIDPRLADGPGLIWLAPQIVIFQLWLCNFGFINESPLGGLPIQCDSALVNCIHPLRLGSLTSWM
jgi:hypothetical protein